jgi:hypothetical protein
MQSFAMQSFFQEFNVSFYFTARTKHATNLQNSECIVFPFIIWFYGSAIVIIRGWGCGFGDSEDIVTWSDNRPSFTVLGFMAVVAYCRGI